MLNIPRLRDVLKKLETTSHLAKYLIKRATVVVGAINKEYGGAAAAISSNNFPSPSVTSSLLPQTVTSHLDSLLSSPFNTTSSTSEKLGSGTKTKTEFESSPGGTRTRTTEIKLMYTEQEKQLKKIKAALLNASLFSRTASCGGVVVELVSNCRNLRDQQNSSVLNQKYKNGEENLSTTAKQNQSNRNMSEAKVKEEVALSAAAQDKEEAANTKQLGEKVSYNGASCGSGTTNDDQDRQQEHNGKEKSCFKGSLADILHFMELVGNLKHTKRTGWVLRDVNDCESISGHMYRMSMMTFLLEENEGLDRIRCMELALVHDLAESLVGDLTPFCGVAKEDKKAMELKAMADICDLLKPRGKRIMELFEEYEEGQSAESKFVKDLDRLDMVMQAFEYEKRDNCLMKHQEFFDSTEGKFQHPFVQKLVKEICDQRKSLVEAKLVAKGGDINLKTVTPNCPPCLEHKNERS